MSESGPNIEHAGGANSPECVSLREDKQKVIDIFVARISRGWNIPADVVYGWVTDEFFSAESIVSCVRDKGEIVGGECAVPFDVVLTHMQEEERNIVFTAVQEKFPDLEQKNIIHLGGLGILPNYEGSGLGQKIHQYMIEQIRQRGCALILGQTYTNVSAADGRFDHSWKRNMEHGW